MTFAVNPLHLVLFHLLEVLRLEDVHRRYGILLLGDAATLHLALDDGQFIGAKNQVVVNPLWLAKLYAELMLVDGVDQLRAVVDVVVEAKCSVVALAQEVVILNLDILPFGALEPIFATHSLNAYHPYSIPDILRMNNFDVTVTIKKVMAM